MIIVTCIDWRWMRTYGTCLCNLVLNRLAVGRKSNLSTAVKDVRISTGEKIWCPCRSTVRPFIFACSTIGPLNRKVLPWVTCSRFRIWRRVVRWMSYCGTDTSGRAESKFWSYLIVGALEMVLILLALPWRSPPPAKSEYTIHLK